MDDHEEQELNLQIINMEDQIRYASELLSDTHHHIYKFELTDTAILRGCRCGLAAIAKIEESPLRWRKIEE